MKMVKTNALLLALFIIGGAFSSFAQPLKDLNPTEWELLLRKDGVAFYGRVEVCAQAGAEKPSEFAFLKVVNETDQPKSANFHFGLEYVEECHGCDDNSEYGMMINIPANGSVEADCTLSEKALWRVIRNRNLPGGWHYTTIKIVNPLID